MPGADVEVSVFLCTTTTIIALPSSLYTPINLAHDDITYRISLRTKYLTPPL
jgi:hypothetical protein